MTEGNVSSRTINVTQGSVVELTTDNVLGVPVRFLAWEPHFEGCEELPGQEGVWWGWLCLSPLDYVDTTSVVVVLEDGWRALLLCPVYVDVTTGYSEVVEIISEDKDLEIRDLLREMFNFS